MRTAYTSITINVYTSDNSCFMWVYKRTETPAGAITCPLNQEPSRTTITKTYNKEILKNFDLVKFLDSLSTTKNDINPKIVELADDICLKLPEKGWRILNIQNVGHEILMNQYSTEETPNIVIPFSQKTYSYQIQDHYMKTNEDLENKKAAIIMSEHYDGYYYSDDGDGNQSCSGISIDADRDSCESFQEKYPDYCKNCKSPIRVNL